MTFNLQRCAWAFLLFAVLGVVLSRSAHAQLVKGSPVGAEVSVGTTVPFLVGGKGTAHFPLGFFAELELGWMPELYVDTINNVAKSFGGYDEPTADLLKAALGNAFSWRLTGGWRPFDPVGFEIFAGYTMIAFGGSPVDTEAVEETTGEELPDRFEGQQVSLNSDLHNFHVGLGWREEIENFVIQFSVAYFQTFASSSGIEVPTRNAQERDQVRIVSAEVDDYLNNIYTTYLKLPVVSLFLGYRFL